MSHTSQNGQQLRSAATMATSKMTTRLNDVTPETPPANRPFLSPRTAIVAAAAAALGLGSCATDAPQDTWKPAGENAQMIHDLQWPVFLAAGVVGVIVFGVIAVAIVKFRDRGQPMPEQAHGKAWLEYSAIALSATILIVIAVPTVATVMALNKSSDTECVINVTGQQWWWEYDYPTAEDGSVCGFMPSSGPTDQVIVTSGQLVMPTDSKVLVRGTSRDVIHSYWIPKLNGKRDMVPGRTHLLRLEADQPGIYAGQCTEFCGLSHANMRMEAVALSPADFQSWLDNQLEPYQSPDEGTLAATGEQTFITQCSRCHQVDGLTDADGVPIVSRPEQFVWSGAAPNLTNLMTRNTFAGASFDLLDEEQRDVVWNAPPDQFGPLYLEGVAADDLNAIQLREWLRNAPAMKPMYTDPTELESTDGKTRGMPDLGLSENQIDELVAYLIERK